MASRGTRHDDVPDERALDPLEERDDVDGEKEDLAAVEEIDEAPVEELDDAFPDDLDTQLDSDELEPDLDDAEEDEREGPDPDFDDDAEGEVEPGPLPPGSEFDDGDELTVVAVEGDDQQADDVDGLRAGEFVCRSCYMAKRESALADPKRMLCRDCA